MRIFSGPAFGVARNEGGLAGRRVWAGGAGVVVDDDRHHRIRHDHVRHRADGGRAARGGPLRHHRADAGGRRPDGADPGYRCRPDAGPGRSEQGDDRITAYPTFDDVGKGEAFIDGNGNGKYDAGETYKDCNGNGKHDADRGKADAGDAGDVVVYQFDYDWPLLTLDDDAADRQGRQVSHSGAAPSCATSRGIGSGLGKEHANCNL